MSVRSGDSSPSKKKAGLSSHSYDHELAEGQHAHLTTAGDVDWDQLPVIPGLVNQTHQRRRPTWMGKVWDTFDAPVEERRLLFKLDAAILTVASLGYCIKNISQTAINNAFVSGMREELGMTGNQLTTAISYVSTRFDIVFISESPSCRRVHVLDGGIQGADRDVGHSICFHVGGRCLTL